MRDKATALALALLLAACAQVRDISGGDKDVAGPVLLSAVPANYSTSFSAERILLHFDERVQVERARDRLLVSPPLDAAPEVRVVRSTDVEILLKAPLRANTTYTFSMGEVVKDLTEGNYAAGMDYVVSTGTTLDSLRIAGAVSQAFSGEVVKDALVMLYAADDTCDLQHGKPTYATRTDTNGGFLLQHLRAGSYRIAALRDQNGNYRYDLPNEEIAFDNGTVNAAIIDSTYAPIALRLFQEVSKEQHVREALVTTDGAWRMVLARPAQTLLIKDVERIGGVLAWTPEWSRTRDTVLLWPTDTTALSEGRYQIATEEGALDTLRYRPLRKMPYYTALTCQQTEGPTGLTVSITSARPIASFDRDRFLLTKDSTTVPFTLTADSSDQRHLTLHPQLEAGGNATLTILPKAVRDLYAGTNDTLRTSVGRAAEQRTGTLRVTVEGNGMPVDGEWLLQLLDAQGRVVHTASAQSGVVVTWERLTPGNHTLRLIADADRNGRWDTGRWSDGVQPEIVWHHKEVLNVRAAWDLGITWKLDRP